MRIHAYAARAKGARLAAFEYEAEALGAHDVEIAVTHCGICHSDVHLVDGDWGTGSYPMVPGHEIVGIVTEAGGEAPFRTGDRLGVGWQRSACLRCELCVSGHENLCARTEATCVGHHGGFADRVRVDGRFAFPIPEPLSSEAAAPLLCGGATVYAPLRRWARSDARIGVVGVGGLGHLALQFARAMGCEVTAISSSPDKEAEARSLGAHRFVATREAGALRSTAGSLDLIVSTVYVAPDWKGLVRALRPNGVLCLVGAPDANMSIVPDTLLAQKIVTGSSIASRSVIREMLDFAARHGVAARTEPRPMSDADAALDRVRKGSARYRVVLAA